MDGRSWGFVWVSGFRAAVRERWCGVVGEGDIFEGTFSGSGLGFGAQRTSGVWVQEAGLCGKKVRKKKQRKYLKICDLLRVESTVRVTILGARIGLSSRSEMAVPVQVKVWWDLG